MDQNEISDFDYHLLNEGRHFRAYDKLGAQFIERDGVQGVRFTVWAPHAREVSVIGDFNGWEPASTPLAPQWPLGLWTSFVPHLATGARYKYSILNTSTSERIDKSDPCGFYNEVPPQNASRAWDLDGYKWQDTRWLASRASLHRLDAPIAIYEVHLGSWMRVPEQGNRRLTYAEVAPLLADHVEQMGFTHIQLMPLAEHPHDDSLGYDPTGFFAPSARYGTPQDLMSLVDQMHQRGIGVILEWAIGRFPLNAHGPSAFDGQPLYEVADTPAIDKTIPATTTINPPPTARFDLKNRQVQNFLLSSALYWLDRYHLDGIKVAGLEDLLFPEAAGKSPERLHTIDRQEDPEAVSLLRVLTDRIRVEHPGTLLIAEDTTLHRQVTRPIAEGGLGFDLIDGSRLVSDFYRHYLCVEPDNRPAEHDRLTTVPDRLRDSRLILPFTYRETGGPKTSAISKLPGDDWRRFANMRLLLGFLYTLPAKKAVFMGTELGSRHPWNPASSLDWHLRGQPRNKGLSRWLRDLNTQYRGQPALHAGDCQPDGFAWLDQRDNLNSVVCYIRKWRDDQILVVCNFKTKPLHNYRVGAPVPGDWEEILNSDAPIYGGSGQGNLGGLETSPVPWHGHPQSLNLIVPPLGMLAFRSRRS